MCRDQLNIYQAIHKTKNEAWDRIDDYPVVLSYSLVSLLKFSS